MLSVVYFCDFRRVYVKWVNPNTFIPCYGWLHNTNGMNFRHQVHWHRVFSTNLTFHDRTAISAVLTMTTAVNLCKGTVKHTTYCISLPFSWGLKLSNSNNSMVISDLMELCVNSWVNICYSWLLIQFWVTPK